MTINEKMFLTLQEKKLKQHKLAEHLNVNQNVITTWKNRKTDPPAKYIAAIAEFLGIRIYGLLGVEDNELNENEKELLQHFNKLPEREQLKLIGKIEEIAERYSSAKSLDSKIG